MNTRIVAVGSALLALAFAAAPAPAQSKKKAAAPAAKAAAAAPQKLDEEYTRLIKQYLQDPRITTELVDHMPASDTVPSPLKFLGRIPGTPGELTYAKDIERYYEALAKASPRAKFWKIGHHRRRPRHRDAGHRRRSHHQEPRQVQGDAGASSAIRARSLRSRRRSCSTPPSRSTGSIAASTRPRPAARKC